MKSSSPEKTNLHPRNPHRFRYDFAQLIHSCADMSPYVQVNEHGTETINFADPSAVKMLNKALLKHFYGIEFWDIPENYLCPPIPGRADYIHYIADLLAGNNNGVIPTGKTVSVLDIGTGANCVYPIIGNRTFGWHFTGTDIDPVAIDSAKRIIQSNGSLSDFVDIRIQKSSANIFRGIILPDDLFDVTICNPPFHSSPEEAAAGTLRKLNNLSSKKIKTVHRNFGGQNRELWYPGGEESFIRTMINESIIFKTQCLWFTTLVSKKHNLPGVYKALKKVKAVEVKKIEMSQGQKVSRIVAWSFLSKDERLEWSKKYFYRG